LAVYTPLQENGLARAAFANSLVGLAVDSVVFLRLTFGSFEFLPGQIAAKLLMALLTLPRCRGCAIAIDASDSGRPDRPARQEAAGEREGHGKARFAWIASAQRPRWKVMRPQFSAPSP
jgi:hypothetical protein